MEANMGLTGWLHLLTHVVCTGYVTGPDQLQTRMVEITKFQPPEAWNGEAIKAANLVHCSAADPGRVGNVM